MTDSAQNLQLTLSVTETNQILEALGQRTYADVFRLITKIQQQANAQLKHDESPPARESRHSTEQIPAPDQPPT